MKCKLRVLASFIFAGFLSACGSGGGSSSNSIPATSSTYMVVAWNDLGMHCLNPSYDTAVILPPYNTVWAQVIKRGNKPQVVTSGLTVSYRMLNNSTSQGKGLFYQFWTYAQTLFGASPALDHGLNLDDPTVSNGLSGTMLVKGSHFQVSGIPVVPYEDGSVDRKPYQVVEVTVKDSSGAIVAKTNATVPTSEEINCGKCHAVGGTITQVFRDVLAKHDKLSFTNISTEASKPVLCAKCHGSPALGTTGPGSSGKYLSQAIHGFHATLPLQPTCYDCHPGVSTKCNRSTKHMNNNNAADGNCVTCHGSLANVAASITAAPPRIPWVTEPKCSAISCHSSTIPQMDTGINLYRNEVGHGGVYCAGCHGSPHAMVPSNQPSDNYQALQYQSAAMTIGDCRTCHEHGTSRGGGSASEFAKEHNTGDKWSACNVCHTGFTDASNTAKWPHQFQWKSR